MLLTFSTFLDILFSIIGWALIIGVSALVLAFVVAIVWAIISGAFKSGTGKNDKS